jgi:hypothetical protein
MFRCGSNVWLPMPVCRDLTIELGSGARMQRDFRRFSVAKNEGKRAQSPLVFRSQASAARKRKERTLSYPLKLVVGRENALSKSIDQHARRSGCAHSKSNEVITTGRESSNCTWCDGSARNVISRTRRRRDAQTKNGRSIASSVREDCQTFRRSELRLHLQLHRARRADLIARAGRRGRRG